MQKKRTLTRHEKKLAREIAELKQKIAMGEQGGKDLIATLAYERERMKKAYGLGSSAHQRLNSVVLENLIQYYRGCRRENTDPKIEFIIAQLILAVEDVAKVGASLKLFTPPIPQDGCADAAERKF